MQDIPTLRQLWAHGQQVIVSYEDETCVGRHAELWPGIPYWWGNKVKSQALLQYLETMRSCGRPGATWDIAGGALMSLVSQIGMGVCEDVTCQSCTGMSPHLSPFPCRWPVCGWHQSHRKPALCPLAPIRVPGDADTAQPSAPRGVGASTAARARIRLHQHHRWGLRGLQQLCG